MPTTTFQFGAYTLDRHGTLCRGGVPVPLQARPAELLLLLVERGGEVVTREAIRERLWPDTVVDFDRSINYGVRQIRIALGPDAGILQTVARRGYRFTAPVIQGQPAERLAESRGRPRTAAGRWIGAALLVVTFMSGVGTGVLMEEPSVVQFVYEHVAHPDRCPYLRFLIPARGNS
jgi:DNA-binding winged helix-turn-helix (wHTH) protein